MPNLKTAKRRGRIAGQLFDAIGIAIVLGLVLSFVFLIMGAMHIASYFGYK